MNHRTKLSVAEAIQATLSFATLLTALAFVLGWIYKQYYFGSFGLAHESLVFPVHYYLVASWFTVQSFLLLLTLFLVATQVNRVWFYGYLILYALVPIGSHYAFWYDCWPARLLIDTRHHILKFGALVPAIVLLGVWWYRRSESQDDGRERKVWNPGVSARVILAAIAISWALSTAKHFGSYDAQRAIHAPQQFLPAIQIIPKDGAKLPELPAAPRDRYRFLLLNDGKYYVWDTVGLASTPKDQFRILMIPQEQIAGAELGRPREVKIP